MVMSSSYSLLVTVLAVLLVNAIAEKHLVKYEAEEAHLIGGAVINGTLHTHPLPYLRTHVNIYSLQIMMGARLLISLIRTTALFLHHHCYHQHQQSSQSM